MDRIQQLEGFHRHLLDNGYSETASKNYRFRVSTFLKRRPEALGGSCRKSWCKRLNQAG